jgi:hypothetical protein
LGEQESGNDQPGEVHQRYNPSIASMSVLSPGGTAGGRAMYELYQEWVARADGEGLCRVAPCFFARISTRGRRLPIAVMVRALLAGRTGSWPLLFQQRLDNRL